LIDLLVIITLCQTTAYKHWGLAKSKSGIISAQYHPQNQFS